MAKQLFEKVAAFTDIHFGLKNDSRQHNIDCETFINWFIEESKLFGAETCIFLGDWHHSRARTGVSTMNYSLSNIEKLSNSFEKVYFLAGNHDLYYRDKREINSIEWATLINNVEVISEITMKDDVILVPWLVGDDWKQIKKLKNKYMFGHFELPYFKMNQMIEMPNVGNLHENHFSNFDYVFSGHFHKRQQSSNVIYIGNPFPHNFADVDDDERGMMFLEWDEKPIFKNWPGAPKYRRFSLSQLLEDPELYVDNQTYARVEIDLSLSFDELTYIKEIIDETYKLRDLTIIPKQEEEYKMDFGGELNFESVDSVVLSHIKSIESQNINNGLLAQIYRAL